MNETDDGRISTERAIGILRHKKVRRVLDNPTSTGHAPDRSRYFIRGCDIFQADDRRRTMGNGPPWSTERIETPVHCESLSIKIKSTRENIYNTF